MTNTNNLPRYIHHSKCEIALHIRPLFFLRSSQNFSRVQLSTLLCTLSYFDNHRIKFGSTPAHGASQPPEYWYPFHIERSILKRAQHSNCETENRIASPHAMIFVKYSVQAAITAVITVIRPFKSFFQFTYTMQKHISDTLPLELCHWLQTGWTKNVEKMELARLEQWTISQLTNALSSISKQILCGSNKWS